MASRRVTPVQAAAWLVAIVALALAALKLALLSNHAILNPGGDASVRVMLSIQAAREPATFVLRNIWEINWPPGQFLLLAPIFHIGSKLFGPQVDLGVLAAGISAVAFSAGLVLIFFFVCEIHERSNRNDGTASVISRAMGAILAFVVFAGSVLPNRLSVTAQSESLALPAVLFAAILSVRYIRGRAVLWQVTLAWFLAAFVRADAIFLALPVTAYLILRTRWWKAILFMLVVSSFNILKQIVGLFNQSYQYLDYALGRSLPTGLEALGNAYRILEPRFSSWSHEAVWFLALASVLLIVAQRKVPYGFVFAVAYAGPYLVLIMLGLQPPIDRFLYMPGLFLAVSLGEAFGEVGVWIVDRFRSRWVLRVAFSLGTLGVILVTALGVVRAAEALKDARMAVHPEVQRVERWLTSNLESNEGAFFDFLRFDGAFLNASLQNLYQRRDNFDYTTYYTRLPRVNRSSSFWREALASSGGSKNLSTLFAVEAYAFIGLYQPTVYVVASGEFARELEASYGTLLGRYLEEVRAEDPRCGGRAAWSLNVPQAPWATADLCVEYENSMFMVLRG